MFPLSDDKFKEECGVFGIFDNKDAAALTVLGLHALQHRGQEAAGIVSFDGKCFSNHYAFGKVGDNFNSDNIIQKLKGNFAIGHNRYSTSGSKKNPNDIQPIFAETNLGEIAIAHNGNLTNANQIRKELVSKGSIFRTTMDTEVIVHLIATSNADDFSTALVESAKKIEGGYAMIAMDQNKIIGLRDPLGIRPLVLGKLDGSYILTSESCALDIIDAEFIRDIKPGEMVEISKDTRAIKSSSPFSEQKPSRFCIFEYVYFSRPDSFVEGNSVYELRKQMGRELAKTCKVDVDLVVPVPDSGVPAALGFSEEYKVPFEFGIIRNHYVGRTFIEPTDNIRHLGVKLKHSPNKNLIKGKKVLLIDDSIVRGTTSKKIVDMMRNAGAKEVHFRISSPPTTHPCFYGVDTPEKEKLLAHKMTVNEMCKFTGADSLEFLSVDSLYKAVGETKRNVNIPQYCDACFTGDYPIPQKIG